MWLSGVLCSTAVRALAGVGVISGLRRDRVCFALTQAAVRLRSPLAESSVLASPKGMALKHGHQLSAEWEGKKKEGAHKGSQSLFGT